MEKNKTRVCKICDRSFSSGKAIGGHMRSHFVTLPVPPKSETPTIPISPPSSSSLTINPRKRPVPNFGSSDNEFSTIIANSDKENKSETYLKNPTRKRSKRRRRFVQAAEAEEKVEPKSVSLMSDAHPAEEAARSLLMLFKDKRPGRKRVEKIKDGEKGKEESLSQTCSQPKFKCKICQKVFQSYQALGGHKASHKKLKNQIQEEAGDYGECNGYDDGHEDSNGGVVDQKYFECSYCFKVFESGQALGGHKKVHFSNIMAANTKKAASRDFRGTLLIDLNLPPPEEDDEEASQIALSTVSSEN